MAQAHISVWLDATSGGRDRARWIVSLEDEGSRTLSVHDTESAARRAGHDEAIRRGLKYTDEVSMR